MAALVYILLTLTMFATIYAEQSGPKLSFYNYSGMQAIVSCMDYQSMNLEAGKIFSIPLTRSDQECIVTLKDGEHASAAIDKMLPMSSSSGLSVSVNINDAYLFSLWTRRFITNTSPIIIVRVNASRLRRPLIFNCGPGKSQQMNEVSSDANELEHPSRFYPD